MQKKISRNQQSNDYLTFPELQKALEVAIYYGFTLSEPIKTDKTIRELGFNHDEIISIFKKNFSNNQPQLPIMDFRLRASQEKKVKKAEFCLDIIGSQRSITDATMIAACYQIGVEEGYEDIYIEINTIGDRDSYNRFNRELGSFIRKNISNLDPECRQAIKKNVLAFLRCDHEKCQAIRDEAPHPINFLSEPSRTHFKEVLEFLEMSQFPYMINNNLIEDDEYALHTVFSIFGTDPAKKQVVKITHGTRWNNIAKKVGLKKDIPGISAVVCAEKTSEKIKKIKKPEFYLIQMGQEAKLRSLELIEILRKVKIPVYHSLTKDKFAAQFSSAEYFKVPRVLIIGQKESLEHTVLVRTMSNRSQETVKLTDIADYLKKSI